VLVGSVAIGLLWFCWRWGRYGDSSLGVGEVAILASPIPTGCVIGVLSVADGGTAGAPTLSGRPSPLGSPPAPPQITMDVAADLLPGVPSHLVIEQSWARLRGWRLSVALTADARHQALPESAWREGERKARFVLTDVLAQCGADAGWDGGIACTHSGSEPCLTQ
jgi:hypothetical protein